MKTSLQKTNRRAKRLRHKLRKTAGGRPRLSVFRSGKHISVQVIDDVSQVTLAAASSQEKAFKDAGGKTGADVAAAGLIGKLIAERAIKAGVKQVVFDRGAFIYHGRVKALADAARAGGLDF
jgi:large subunit ribosomal protein L18